MLSTFRKLDEVLIDPMVDEGLYREMIGFFADWVADRAVRMIEAGADVVEIGGNMAGSAVGPAFFEKYVSLTNSASSTLSTTTGLPHLPQLR